MDILSHLKKHLGDKAEALHHAYIFTGEKDVFVPPLKMFLEESLGISTKANPDCWYGEFGTYGISDARILKEMQNKKALGGGLRVFIIALDSITHEAQNSLLKIFEEPSLNTIFILIMPEPSSLLPTLRSRVIVVPRIEEDSNSLEVEKFLRTSHFKRLLFIESFIKEKSSSQAIQFLNRIEQSLYGIGGPSTDVDKYIPAYEEIQKCRGYLHSRGASVKGILEYVALIIPIVPH